MNLYYRGDDFFKINKTLLLNEKEILKSRISVSISSTTDIDKTFLLNEKKIPMKSNISVNYRGGLSGS